MTTPDMEKCCDGECNHDDCCGKIPENCSHRPAMEEVRCTKCGGPFLDHHHRHITREGTYHTSCYETRATPATTDWKKVKEARQMTTTEKGSFGEYLEHITLENWEEHIAKYLNQVAPSYVGHPQITLIIRQLLDRQKAALVEALEKMRRVVPKDPLDITPREQMEQVIQPVYRPYISNEEAANQVIDAIQALLRREEEKVTLLNEGAELVPYPELDGLENKPATPKEVWAKRNQPPFSRDVDN